MNGLSAKAPTQIVTHVYGQKSLEILGSRLAGAEPCDDELQETSYVEYVRSFYQQNQDEQVAISDSEKDLRNRNII